MMARQAERYDHVYITLKLQEGSTWNWVKAHNWSETGFNFFFNGRLAKGEQFTFKKALHQFPGTLVWKCDVPTREQLNHMAINSLLTRRFKERISAQGFDKDFIDLLRSEAVGDKLDYARKFLGFNISKTMLDDEITHHKWDEVSRYGVQMQDENWGKVVKAALGYSAGLLELDQIQQSQFVHLSKL